MLYKGMSLICRDHLDLLVCVDRFLRDVEPYFNILRFHQVSIG